jgi:hypothetical protein
MDAHAGLSQPRSVAAARYSSASSGDSMASLSSRPLLRGFPLLHYPEHCNQYSRAGAAEPEVSGRHKAHHLLFVQGTRNAVECRVPLLLLALIVGTAMAKLSRADSMADSDCDVTASSAKLAATDVLPGRPHRTRT